MNGVVDALMWLVVCVWLEGTLSSTKGIGRWCIEPSEEVGGSTLKK